MLATIAREGRAAYDTSATTSDTTPEPGDPGLLAPWDRALDGLATALDTAHHAVADGDALTLEQVQGLLERVQTQTSRVLALRTRLTELLARLAQATAPRGAHGRGEREAARFLTDELNLAPAEAKRTATTGRRLAATRQAREAFDDGALSEGQAAVIARRLTDAPFEHRPAFERDLVDAARTMHPPALDREARRLLAQLDVEALERAAARDAARTSVSWHRDDDGALAGRFRLYGVDAEKVEVALRAATPAPRPDDHRSDDRRRADVLVTLADLSLRAGELPAEHGVRPHVVVTVDADTLAGRHGTVTLASGATVPLTEAGHLLGDCSLTRLVVDATGVPLEGTAGSRHVPAAVWKALLVRDGGCTWGRCDAPAAWCQVAHGAIPHGAGGQLTLDNAALLCPRHHRRFDAGGWAMLVEGGRVRYERDPTRPPVRAIVEMHRRAAGAAAPPCPSGGRELEPTLDLEAPAGRAPDRADGRRDRAGPRPARSVTRPTGRTARGDEASGTDPP